MRVERFLPVASFVAAWLAGADASAACTVHLTMPPHGVTVSQSPKLRWASDCVSWRAQYSHDGGFAADRVQSPVRTVTRYQMPEEVWDDHLVNDGWAGGVWWRVVGTAEDGTVTTTPARYMSVLPDLDDDGVAERDGDCDDLNPEVHPGAPEVCGGGDEDCDGLVDEGFDADGDGYTSCGGDCDEGDPGVHPGASETCEDGVDQDCDGIDPECGGGGGEDWYFGDALASITLPNYFSDYDAGKDITGDGIDDVVVGDYYANLGGGSYSGAVYVFEGPVAGPLTPADATYRLSGVAGSDYAGATVRFAGDVNGDGYEDLIVGATGVDEGGIGGRGAAYLVYGPVSGDMSLGWAGARLLGEAANDSAGGLVAPAGDVNGDGFGDLLVGAQNFDYGGVDSRGAVYLVHGPIYDDFLLSWAAARRMGGAAYERVPSSLAPLGDTDGDGFDDFAVGGYSVTHGAIASNGAAYLLRGPVSGSATLSTADLVVSGDATSMNLGYSVGPVGDQDGDGLPDFAVTAQGANAYKGRVYVFPGSLDGEAGPSSALATVDYAAMSEWDYGFDHEVAPRAGDGDGDGVDDLLFAWSIDGATQPRVGVFLSPAAGGLDADGADARFMPDVPYIAGMDKPRWHDADLDGADDVTLSTYNAGYVIYVFDGP